MTSDDLRAAFAQARTAVTCAVDAALGELARRQGGIAIPTGREARDAGVAAGSARMTLLADHDVTDALVELLAASEQEHGAACRAQVERWDQAEPQPSVDYGALA